MSSLSKRILTLLLLLSLFGSMGVRCFDDSEMIDRHQKKLDEDEE